MAQIQEIYGDTPSILSVVQQVSFLKC